MAPLQRPAAGNKKGKEGLLWINNKHQQQQAPIWESAITPNRKIRV